MVMAGSGDLDVFAFCKFIRQNSGKYGMAVVILFQKSLIIIKTSNGYSRLPIDIKAFKD